jgi:hypothetical protein
MPKDAFIDLDAVVSPDIRVALNGTRYRLPGDAPSETMLHMLMLFQQFEEIDPTQDPQKLVDLREELAEEVENLFRIRQPDLPEGSITLSDPQLGELLAKLFSHYYPNLEGEEEEERPTSASSTPQRQRSGRRSPRSSTARSRTKSESASSTSSPT